MSEAGFQISASMAHKGGSIHTQILYFSVAGICPVPGTGHVNRAANSPDKKP